ncbi:glyoxalase/bleomycin resistance/extradiol dioxygenase family protein [Paenibacillus sp. PK3_47]|uniref:VOC family protein n=1 Tax=Paenibacillus sp. PK3_47 TaxID=2072642 RepID=UPI00201D5AA5|nr:VOC family protein [Paenibacillus sp. PK3_47]UQZ35980.1 glyoxalase/bleomycin resistance/extradiol dioxygenase family protein [Paenibacillus sp. PK3_47]
MGFQAGQVFINFPVKDLQASVEFFTAVGFEFDPNYTDENATCMIINDKTYAMLLTREFFSTFSSKAITDTSSHTEVITAISAVSREQVDELVKKALAAGGKPYNDPSDMGFMYTWSFQDIDGHLWEIMYMDENAQQ